MAEAALSLSGGLDPADGFAALHDLLVAEDLDRPVLVSEYGFRAADSGLPNTWPPIYPTFDTQAERAAAFEEVTVERQETPWIVGAHWFRWMDEPADGRFDGENSNFGLVDLEDRPYAELTEAMGRVHPRVYEHLAVP